MTADPSRHADGTGTNELQLTFPTTSLDIGAQKQDPALDLSVPPVRTMPRLARNQVTVTWSFRAR